VKQEKIQKIQKTAKEEGLKEGKEEGLKEAEQKASTEKEESARHLLSLGILTEEQIAQTMGLTLKMVKTLK
jgi:flagellar biosynthesis/type III secretory pathway protein FliH